MKVAKGRTSDGAQRGKTAHVHEAITRLDGIQDQALTVCLQTLDDEILRLRQEADNREVIGTAMGILIARSGCTSNEASQALLKQARHFDIEVLAAAGWIVAGATAR